MLLPTFRFWEAAHLTIDTSDELIEIKRLDEEIIGADLKRRHPPPLNVLVTHE